MPKNAKKSICYRVCDKNGWTKFDSLDELDEYLDKSEEIPLPEVVLRYNKAVKRRK